MRWAGGDRSFSLLQKSRVMPHRSGRNRACSASIPRCMPQISSGHCAYPGAHAIDNMHSNPTGTRTLRSMEGCAEKANPMHPTYWRDCCRCSDRSLYHQLTRRHWRDVCFWAIQAQRPTDPMSGWREAAKRRSSSFQWTLTQRIILVRRPTRIVPTTRKGIPGMMGRITPHTPSAMLDQPSTGRRHIQK